MFHNYLVTALRNFTRQKLYSCINVVGFTVGLTCAIFIILFIRDQLSYDEWIPGSQNLYRVEATINIPGQAPLRDTKIPFAVPHAMREQIPEVKTMTRLMPESMTTIVGNRQFPETVDVVDPNFFQVIKLPLVAGDPVTVFAQPESVVVSQSIARKYFGDAAAAGKTITISGRSCDQNNENCQTKEHLLIVTGVMQDLPHNTQLAAEVVIPNTSNADPQSQVDKENWLNQHGWGYVVLAAGSNSDAVADELKTIIDRSVNLTALVNIKMRASDLMVPHLVHFRDDHLSTDRYDSMTPAGSWTTVYGFAAIGMLILLVACFNFTNLATARATLRAREISLRKVMGATRGQLIVQFLGEALLTAMVSLVLALALVEMLLPSFDDFLDAPIEFHYFTDWRLLLTIVALTIGAGLLSGAYPALVLSGFRPATVLRTNAAKQSGSGLLRASLVVLQFAVSIGLGIAAMIVFAQISFARNIDLGFQKSGVVLIDGESLSPGARESFARALRFNPDILDAAISDKVPFDGNNNNMDVHVPGGLSNEVFHVMSISPDYPRLYGIRLLAGRFLSASHGGDVSSQKGQFDQGTPYNVLINAAAARHFGYSIVGAIGKTFILHKTSVTIVGVIADVKMAGARGAITGTIYHYLPENENSISVRVRSGHLADTLSFIDKTWRSFAPSTALRRHFLNDDFEKQFLADQRQGTIFDLFVGIAIFIACLGLFGLAAFTAQRRTKEIGIRRVFGARTSDIVLLLLWQFSVPVLIANLIAWPLAYYYLHNWLEGYVYRISLSPLYFATAGAVALLIAWATIYAQAQRVARANPIHALRYE